MFEHFHPRVDFGWKEVLALRDEHPEWFMANRHLARNEGSQIGTGQKLWKRAKRVIPGGNMLLSKRAGDVPAGALARLFQQGEGLPGLGPRRP